MATRGRPPKETAQDEIPMDENTPNEDPPEGHSKGVKIRHEGLAGQRLWTGDGEEIDVDKNGVFSVPQVEADRLLTIPGYEKA